MHLSIYADGASWGNPGPAAIGAVIKDGQQNVLAEVSRHIGNTTNNQAEYQAVIAGLKEAARFEADEVTLYVDSELVARQLTGRYKVRNLFLFPLYREASELTKRFSKLSIELVGHDGNHEAHALAAEVLKKYRSKNL